MPIAHARVFDASIIAGQSALRVAIVINGAAATAVLALISSVYKEDRVLASHLAAHLPMLGFGVAAAAVATGATYCTLELKARKRHFLWEAFNWLTIVLVAASFVLFCVAIWGISGDFSPPVNIH